MLKKIIAVPIFLLMFFGSTAYASGVALGIKIGTLGGGIEMEKPLTDTLTGRIGLNYLSYSYEGTEDDIDYDFDLNLKTLGAMLDWHPFENGFRITGGVFYNGNELDASATPGDNATFDIGDTEYRGSDVGNLTGTIDFNDFAPYVGIGVSTAFGKRKQFAFIFEIGVLFQDEPTVNLSADGPISSDPLFKNELEKEEQNLQDDLDNFQLYPVISFGVLYRF